LDRLVSLCYEIAMPVPSRLILLILCLLSACAASGPDPTSARRGLTRPTGEYAAYLIGRHALASSDYNQATSALLYALRANPDNADLRMQAFTAALIAGRPEAAQFARGVADSPLAQLYLACLDTRADRWDRAETWLLGLPGTGPLQTVQPILVAWARLGAGRPLDALAAMRVAVETMGPRGVIPLHAALIADIAEQTAVADRYYELAAADPGNHNIRTLYLLASWNHRMGRPEIARRLLDMIQGAAPDTTVLAQRFRAGFDKRPVASARDGLAEVFLALGSSLRTPRNGDPALMVLSLALEVAPNFSAARMAVSDIHLGRRHYAAALDVLAPLPRDDLLGPLVELRRAVLLERLERMEEAEQVLSRLAAELPDNPVPDRYLGDMLRGKSRFKDAIGAYDRALARVASPGPGDWILFYNRAIALHRDDQWGRAETDFETALKLSPDQPYVLNYLAYTWAERGVNLDRGRVMLERALRARPNDGAITDSLGWVMFRLGDLPEAVRLMERAIELDPDDPTINAHLGDVYWAVGRRVEALYQWRRALTLNPSPEETRELEQKIRLGYAGPVDGQR
jgi:tetratricopeptide (TPR) repeat protein